MHIGNINPEWVDQQIGSLIEAWYTRDTAPDQCRFCNKQIGEECAPAERFCSSECEESFEKVFEARLALGERDLRQRGYD